MPYEVQIRYDALYHHWEWCLHMRAWGAPEFEIIRADARANFTELVQTGTHFTYVEDCKRDVPNTSTRTMEYGRASWENLRRRGFRYWLAQTGRIGVRRSEDS